MDEAWWLPGPTGVLADTSFAFARQRPGTIYVDEAGQRFVNESNSYVEVGKAMYARNQQSPAVPCWLIFDDGYRRRYSHTKSIRTGHLAPEWFETGLLKKATTIEDLARQCGIDPGGLAATVERFNRNAAKGIDPDFHRGESAYNRTMGDPGFKPNPCLGPLVDAPFYATQIVPADVGTCGGLLTDEYARVLDQEGQPISGLYATGNTTATVMGRHYLGAGASIGNSMVFGYIAAQHACGSVSTAN
jgi:3-oxosteroid 1-dehydrogenase